MTVKKITAALHGDETAEFCYAVGTGGQKVGRRGHEESKILLEVLDHRQDAGRSEQHCRTLIITAVFRLY